MKNKKFLSVILSVCILLCSFSFASFAQEESKASVDVYIPGNYIFDENLFYKGFYSIIGRQFEVFVHINGVENISEFIFEIDYNKESLCLDQHYLNYISSDINYMPMVDQLSKDDEPLKLRLHDKKGIADTELFAYGFRFKAEEKGEIDFSIRVLSLIDGDGNSYEPEINMVLPSETYHENEIPNALPDFDISLSYGISNYKKTELAYSMTVNEFVSKMKNIENCKLDITTADGETLDGDAYIPTGAKLSVTFDNMPVFSTTFVLIGDVNRDAKINAADARLVLRFTAGLDRYNGDDAFRCAANTAKNTEEITAADAREILRYSAGIGLTYADWYEYHCVLEKYNRALINDNL